jgi:DNA polymerase-4
MGIDERDVEPEHDVKSISHEETFARDIVDMNFAKKELLSLSNKVARRMRSEGITGKTVTLKVKYSDFVQITRSTTLLNSTNDGFKIYATSCCLLKKTKVGKRPVRLLGISISQLNLFGTETQLSLFQQDKASSKRERLNAALDSISDKFGEKSVRPGTLLQNNDT